MWTARALLLLADTKKTLPLIGYSLKGLPGVLLQTQSDNRCNRHYIGIYRKEDVLLHLKIRGASEKFKNQPRHLIRPGSVNFRQHYGNPSHATVPLNGVRIWIRLDPELLVGWGNSKARSGFYRLGTKTEIPGTVVQYMKGNHMYDYIQLQ
jgi:hypothetical protein